MTKVALGSDLHLEFADIQLKNTGGADVLVLAGDILVASGIEGEGPKAKLGREFLSRVSGEFKNTVYVAGNHEFYGGKWYDTIETLERVCSSYGNIHFLEDNTVLLDGITFTGGTLWTDLNGGDPSTAMAVAGFMNDYRTIRNERKEYRRLLPFETEARHRATKAYIGKVAEDNPDSKVFVVGHHSPSYQSIHPMYQNDYLVNGAYASDLEQFIMDHPNIVAWVHGHMHNPFDYTVGSTRVVCNPRGYYPHEGISHCFELKYLDI